MNYRENYLIFSFCLLCCVNLINCVEFVPVYMWETSRHSETVPALDRITEDSFKDLLLERLSKNPFIVIFAERNLSPEDFTQHDENGKSPYSNLSELKNNAKVTYWPFVHNPIYVAKQLDKQIVEVTSTKLPEDYSISSDNILIVDLNDATDDEDRIDMLKRHDSVISSVYKEIKKQHDEVLALYTAHHTSWVIPEEVRGNRRARSLLADNTTETVGTGIVFNHTNVLFYINSTAKYEDKETNTTVDLGTAGYVASVDKGVSDVSLTLSSTSASVVFQFNFTFGVNGYWNISSIRATAGTKVSNLTAKNIYAPFSFSYHCTAQMFTSSNETQILTLPAFQVQPFNTTNHTYAFGDAYDCVGFTTAPIWSGLFVTFILVLIMTFGLTMMMDIKTMDRFDDPKGKTITVNVSE